MRKLSVLILSLFMVALSFATTIKGKVIKVADGDTITILEKTRDKTRVRFYGIDAPEKKARLWDKEFGCIKKAD